MRTKTRENLSPDGDKVVLWSGQPNGDDSYQALSRLIKHLPDRRFTLLFRGHPEDEANSDGRYNELLAQAPVTILDVTENNNPLGLNCASDLVITQFSSAPDYPKRIRQPSVVLRRLRFPHRAGRRH